MKYLDAAALHGKTITAIRQVGDDRIEIATSDGKKYVMYHSQECCESVRIYDVEGELQSLIGSPLIVSREETSKTWPEDVETDGCDESYTWTQYFFSTGKADVCVRWLGSSNGYYSEDVQIDEVM